MANSLIRLMIHAGLISGWQSGSYPETGLGDIERGLQVRDFGNEAVVIGLQSLLTISGSGRFACSSSDGITTYKI